MSMNNVKILIWVGRVTSYKNAKIKLGLWNYMKISFFSLFLHLSRH